MFQTSDRTQRARRLRQRSTGPEMVLWEMVRGRRLDGHKFRRQTPIAGFTVDFTCLELKLILELDGGVHDLHRLEDEARDSVLKQAGFTVMRFRNNAFLTNPAIVFDAVRSHAAGLRTQPPQPSGSAAHLLPQGEKGKQP